MIFKHMLDSDPEQIISDLDQGKSSLRLGGAAEEIISKESDEKVYDTGTYWYR